MAATGAPIRAGMETVVVGKLPDGTPVHMDRHAAEADAVVVINRIKPHTGFRGATESGLTKMLSIGIGKIIGASTYHAHGMDLFPELLPRVRDVHLRARNVLFGVGIVENAYDEIEDALYEVRTWLNEINLPYGPHSEAKEWTTPTVCPACGTTLSPRSTTPPPSAAPRFAI